MAAKVDDSFSKIAILTLHAILNFKFVSTARFIDVMD